MTGEKFLGNLKDTNPRPNFNLSNEVVRILNINDNWLKTATPNDIRQHILYLRWTTYGCAGLLKEDCDNIEQVFEKTFNQKFVI